MPPPGGLNELYHSLITLPLAYVEGDGLGALLTRHIDIWRSLIEANLIYGVGLLGLGVLGLALCLGLALRRGAGAKGWRIDRPVSVVLVVTAGLSLSLLMGGVAYAHYWLQMFPLMALLAGIALARVNTLPMRGALLALFAGLVTVIGLQGTTATMVFASKPPPAPLRAIADQLAPRLQPGDEVLALRGHLVLWYLDRDPMIALATHPSNLSKPRLADALAALGMAPEDPMASLLARKPAFLIYARNDASPPPGYSELALKGIGPYSVWQRDQGTGGE